MPGAVPAATVITPVVALIDRPALLGVPGVSVTFGVPPLALAVAVPTVSLANTDGVVPPLTEPT